MDAVAGDELDFEILSIVSLLVYELLYICPIMQVGKGFLCNS